MNYIKSDSLPTLQNLPVDTGFYLSDLYLPASSSGKMELFNKMLDDQIASNEKLIQTLQSEVGQLRFYRQSLLEEDAFDRIAID